MRQEIVEDRFDFADWDLRHGSRCFVHIANSLVWQLVTGERPPTQPPTAAAYTQAGLPWFDHYGDAPALPGSELLRRLESVLERGRAGVGPGLPENQSTAPDRVLRVGPKPRPRRPVREEQF